MRLNSIVNSSILFLALLLISRVSSVEIDDDIATIRQRVLELAIWPPPENVTHTVWYGRFFSEKLNGSCYWEDINYTDHGTTLWNTLNHLNRLTTMVQALRVNGSAAKNDSKLRANVHCALKVWLVEDWQNPNWWFNQIEVPLQTTTQILMLGDDVTSFELQKVVEISYRAA